MPEKTVTFDRGIKGILLLFIVPYTAGARDSESYFNPDITMLRLPSTEYQTGFTTMASKAMTCGVRQAGYLVQKA